MKRKFKYLFYSIKEIKPPKSKKEIKEIEEFEDYVELRLKLKEFKFNKRLNEERNFNMLLDKYNKSKEKFNFKKFYLYKLNIFFFKMFKSFNQRFCKHIWSEAQTCLKCEKRNEK